MPRPVGATLQQVLGVWGLSVSPGSRAFCGQELCPPLAQSRTRQSLSLPEAGLPCEWGTCPSVQASQSQRG